MFGSIGKSVSKSLGSALSGGTGISPDMFGKSSNDFMSFIPGIGDAMAAEKQNAANKAGAQAQMDFQERMSNTAYQRSMADIKKAGLNPMLAFSQGGASTPSGALPTINSTTKTKLGEFGMSSALGIKNSATAQQQANTAQSSAVSGIDLNKSTAAKNVADTERIRADTKRIKKDTQGKGAVDTLDRAAGNVINKIIDSMSSSAKQSSSDKKREPLIKVHPDQSNLPKHPFMKWLQKKH